MTLPINHLKQTLDRCCGQWEFESHDQSDDYCHPWCAVVRFFNTGSSYQCVLHASGQWTAMQDSDGRTSSFLTSRLNGLTRDDAGNPLPSDFDCVPGVE